MLRAKRLRRIITVAASATTLVAGGAYAAAAGTAGTAGQRNAAPASKGKPFTITGSPTAPIAPGRSAHLDLALTNPNDHAIRVTSITVAVTTTSSDACPVRDNFSVTQVAQRRYPLILPAGGPTRLSQLGVAAGDLPTLALVNSPTRNQDACKGATLELRYSGEAIA